MLHVALLIIRHGKISTCFNFEQLEVSENIYWSKISRTTVALVWCSHPFLSSEGGIRLRRPGAPVHT